MNVGYCTNVHRGVSFEQALTNLKTFAVPVKQAICPDQAMGIGLWFSNEAVSVALQDGNWQRLKRFLDDSGLVAHTFNAFPFTDFHQPVVKRQVYLPDWTSDARARYTMDVARLQALLLPPDSIGTISTVPLGWAARDEPVSLERCASQLNQCAQQLQAIEQTSGVQIRLCLEPEPGCVLQTSDQVVEFFNRYLFSGVESDRHRCRLGVCHDVCHAAVMQESQQAVLQRYHENGISISKVQISSAPEFQQSDQTLTDEILKPFIEPRYLHQTSLQKGGEFHFFEDLPRALKQFPSGLSDSIWRVHFHVPIMLDAVGSMGTTQGEIESCLKWFLDHEYASHFEVETYAWEVSPASVRGSSMTDSIIAELRWLGEHYPNLSSLNRLS